METFRRYIINCFWTKRKAIEIRIHAATSREKTDLRYFPTESQCGTRFRFSLMTNETGESERFDGEARPRPVVPFPMNGSRTLLGIIAAGRCRRIVAPWQDTSRRDTSAFSPRSAMRFRGSDNCLLHAEREKYFLLTSPFIEPVLSDETRGACAP